MMAVDSAQSSAELAEHPRELIQHSSVTRLSLLDVANHHEIDTASILITTSYATKSTAMSNPLAEYLSALEARDAREKAHEEYINACKCYAMRGTWFLHVRASKIVL
jgi:hypothetical protein